MLFTIHRKTSMPGIVGLISQKPRGDCEDLVTSMVHCMRYEPFYASGGHSVPEMGIYVGWTTHRNSFAAGQVFFNERKDIALIFSGECFANPETQTSLRQNGHEFRWKNADWLVHLYEEEGDRFFEKLNGLFSGLLIDKRQRKAFLFNDRFGVERIYWHKTDSAFYFASEAKALLRILPDLREFDAEGVAQFLTFGCTLDGRTLFRNVHLLPGGSVWCLDGENCRKRKYFSPATWEAPPALPAERFEAKFQEVFKRILPHYFESESKIGISLTGGLDSRMIMACRPETAEKPVCYTFSGQNRDTLDARLAARVADACGLNHRTLRIGGDFFSDFASHVDRTVYTTDGCLDALGAHEIYMNAQARQLARVRLTGNYGSEILRGASYFKPLGLSSQLVNPDFGQLMRFSTQELARNAANPVTYAAFREIPQKRFGILTAGRSQSTFRTPYLDNEIVALAYQAPPSLLTSPFPALRFVKSNNPALARIRTDRGLLGLNRTLTSSLRNAFWEATFKCDYLYSEGLPHGLSRLDPLFRLVHSGLGISGLHKFLHYRRWFQRELAGYVNETVTRVRLEGSQLWNSYFLKNMADEHRTGRKNYVREISAVLTLEAVERLLLRQLSHDPERCGIPETSVPSSVIEERAESRC
jgi:asparagine synthase (glutamine-hydrolysing)